MPAPEDFSSHSTRKPKPWRSPWSMDDGIPTTPPPPRRVLPAAEAERRQNEEIAPPRSYQPRKTADRNAHPFSTQDIPFSAELYSRQQHMRWLTPIALITFLLTVLAWVYLRDDALPYDGDMAMPVVDVVGPTPLAVGRLKLLLTTVQGEPSGERHGVMPWTWDTPTLAQVTNANAVPFDNLKDMLAEADWSPNQQAWYNEDLGSHQGWEKLSEAKTIACAYHQRLRQEPAALQAVIDLAQLSKRLQTFSAWPTYYPRGLELHQHACASLAAVLQTTAMDVAALTDWQAAWERLTPQDTALAEAFKGFYEFERKLIVGPRAGDPWDALTVQMLPQRPKRLFFKPNRTLDLFAMSFRELKEQVSRPAYLRSTQISDRIGASQMPPRHLGNPNASGYAYAHERIWPYVNLMESHSLERARHLVVLTLFAVRRWTLDHGRHPATLSELTPHYISALPTDPFSGLPLCYDAEKGLIYSVGIDFRDDHGHATEVPVEDAKEPTVSLR